MKRDYITEILSKKERAKYSRREFILYDRIRALASAVDLCKRITNSATSDPLKLGIAPNDLRENGELHRYIPIGMIACIESYFRDAVKELIDIGSPFSDRALNLREIKFDFTIAQAIQGKKLTIGDFLSHLVPMKSLEEINNTISVLTEKDFLSELKPFFFEKNSLDEIQSIASETEFCEPPEFRFPKLDEISNAQHQQIGKIYQSVKETYRLRNIFCHEAAESQFVDIPAIFKGYDDCVKFLEAANEFIWNEVDPNRPTSNYEISLRLSNELEELELKLKNLVGKIIENADFVRDEFLEVQKSWENYRDKRLDLIETQWDGGSGTGIAMLGESIQITQNRIDELQEMVDDDRYFF